MPVVNVAITHQTEEEMAGICIWTTSSEVQCCVSSGFY